MSVDDRTILEIKLHYKQLLSQDYKRALDEFLRFESDYCRRYGLGTKYDLKQRIKKTEDCIYEMQEKINTTP